MPRPWPGALMYSGAMLAFSSPDAAACGASGAATRTVMEREACGERTREYRGVSGRRVAAGGVWRRVGAARCGGPWRAVNLIYSGRRWAERGARGIW